MPSSVSTVAFRTVKRMGSALETVCAHIPPPTGSANCLVESNGSWKSYRLGVCVMSGRYAVVENSAVTNVIEWDGHSDWLPPDGSEVIPLTDTPLLRPPVTLSLRVGKGTLCSTE
jgi:hypothetical protein